MVISDYYKCHACLVTIQFCCLYFNCPLAYLRMTAWLAWMLTPMVLHVNCFCYRFAWLLNLFSHMEFHVNCYCFYYVAWLLNLLLPTVQQCHVTCIDSKTIHVNPNKCPTAQKFPSFPCHFKVQIYQANKTVCYANVISKQAKLSCATYVYCCILK